jgi:hypothetical protein
VASGAKIKPGEPGEALHREPLDAGDVPLDVPCGCGGTDTGGAIGREALDCRMVASGANASLTAVIFSTPDGAGARR